MSEPLSSNDATRAIRSDLAPSPTLAINEQIKSRMSTGQEVFHLGFGESRFPVHPLIAKALRENADRREYLPTLGLKELRHRVALFYSQQFGLNVDWERVVIGPGSKSLLFAVIAAVEGEIILPTPTWVSYRIQAQLASRSVREVPMDSASGYRPRIDLLRNAVTSAKRPGASQDLLLLNTPHNPTGSMLSEREIQDLATFAASNRLMVASDEIYSLVAHEGCRHSSIAAAYPEGSIVFGGLSKHLSLGGWRLGVALLPKGRWGNELAAVIEAIAGSIWTSASAPIQYAALVAYSGDREVVEYIQTCARLHSVRTRYMYDALIEFGLTCPRPQGAFYLYPSFAQWRKVLGSRGISSSLELADHLMAAYGIAVLPGECFGDSPENLSIRLSTSYIDLETDAKAENMLRAFIQQPDSARFMEQSHPRMRQSLERLADFIGSLENG